MLLPKGEALIVLECSSILIAVLFLGPLMYSRRCRGIGGHRVTGKGDKLSAFADSSEACTLLNTLVDTLIVSVSAMT